MEENQTDNNSINNSGPQNLPDSQPSAASMSAPNQPVVATPLAQPVVALSANEPTRDTSGPIAVNPTPVVKVLSPRGVEYVFLIVTLFAAAISLVSLLIAIVNSQYGFAVLSFPVSALVVSVPLFSLLFLRLKRAELTDPAAKLDASKRRSTQFTQIVTFLVCFLSLIALVTIIIEKIGSNFSSSLFKAIMDVLVVEVVSGGILFYYWRDEHRKVK